MIGANIFVEPLLDKFGGFGEAGVVARSPDVKIREPLGHVIIVSRCDDDEGLSARQGFPSDSSTHGMSVYIGSYVPILIAIKTELI